MELHPGVTCDACRGPVIGVRHKCTVCHNYDLCDDCHEKGYHAEHQMRQFLTPMDGYLHFGVTCDGCRGEVRGIRHKCNDCPNYDLCSECKAKGIHSQHSMREIHQPTQTQVLSSDCTYLHKGIGCDGCKGPVRGIRYKCTLCPNYDLCCECKGKGIHSEHRMKQIHGPRNPVRPPSAQAVTAVQLGELMGRIAAEMVMSPVNRQLEAVNFGSTNTSSSPEASGKASITDDPFTSRWSPAQSGVAFNRVALDISDQEYKDVVANMVTAGGQQWTNKVKQVCRIENHRMYKIYRACKEEMERENPPGFQNERILWHGTSADVLGNIYRGGFNRSYCGKNATAYGDGVYFATAFSYSTSSTYSPPDSSGQKFVFQCRVLTGHFTQGQSGLKEPPMRTTELRDDSVVDAVTSPKMFVIFKDMQVYPEYVITLQL